MPDYTIRDPSSGLTLTIRGDSPPSEAELGDLFAHASGMAQPAASPPSSDATPPSPGGDVLLDNISNVAGKAYDLAAGAGKKLIETGVRGGALLRQIPGVDAFSNALPSVTVNTVPSNTTQKVGGMLEQVAEVAAPARGVMALGQKAATAVAPTLAPIVGRTMARVIPRAAVEGAGMAGLATAQGATPGEAAVSGVLGAAAPTMGEVATSIANKLRSSATGNVEALFHPTTKPMKAIVGKRAGEVLDRSGEVLGTLGRNREGAVEAFSAQRQQAGEAIDEALKTYGSETVQDAPQRIVAALESAKAPYVNTRVMSSAEAMKVNPKFITDVAKDGRTVTVSIPLNSTKVNQIDGLKEIVQAHGDQMTVDDLVGLRRAWDEIAYRRPGTTLETVKTDAAKWAKKMGGDSIRAIISADQPQLSALNREFSFWKDLETVMTATVDRKRGQVGGLLPGMAEGAGRVAGAVSGSLGQAVLVGKAAKLAQQVFASPRYNAISANLKANLADAISRGSNAEAESWLRLAASRIGAVEAPREISLSMQGSISGQP